MSHIGPGCKLDVVTVSRSAWERGGPVEPRRNGTAGLPRRRSLTFGHVEVENVILETRKVVLIFVNVVGPAGLGVVTRLSWPACTADRVFPVSGVGPASDHTTDLAHCLPNPRFLPRMTTWPPRESQFGRRKKHRGAGVPARNSVPKKGGTRAFHAVTARRQTPDHSRGPRRGSHAPSSRRRICQPTAR
jgi:hypothetical protein